MASIEITNLQASFKQAADTYEMRMGMITRSIARHIASNIQLPFNARVCDNACGTGAVMQAILTEYPDASVDACDIAEPMANIAKAVSQEHPWSDRVQVQVANSIQLPYPDAIFDANIINFGIFFTPDPLQAAREIYRTVKPGGIAAVTCWKDSAFWRLSFAIQDIVGPANPLKGLPILDEWKHSEKVKSVMESAGFKDINIEAIPTNATFKTREELIKYCVTNIMPVVNNQWTEEEKAKLPAATAKIIETESDKYVTVDEAGLTHFPWVAWLATATK